MSQSRQLAAIMFTDIVGYTTLMGEDEQKAFEVLEQFKTIASPLITKYHGKWHKDLGDGALCSFGSALDAVNSAIAIQQILNKEVSAKLRIGIHLGDVTFKDEDLYGDGVNVASRIQSEASPGGICISEPVYKTIRNNAGIKAEFLGNRQLKNVLGKTRLYQITTQGIETNPKVSTRVIPVWKSAIITLVFVLLTAIIVWNLAKPHGNNLGRIERHQKTGPHIKSPPLGRFGIPARTHSRRIMS